MSSIELFRSSISKMKPQFESALPKHVSVDKFIRVVQTAVQNFPRLLECDRTSLYSACMKSAQDGLIPDGKEAALVPFGNRVTYMPMVAGVLKKVRNSGELSSITSVVVHKNDKFRYWIDADGEHLEHEPNMFSDRGQPIGVYALAKMKEGGVYVEVLTTQQVKAIQMVSKSKDSPWTGPFADEMWRKSAIRRLSKRLPMSTDNESTLSSDDELFMPPAQDKPETVEVTQPEEEQKQKPVKSRSRTSMIIEKQADVNDAVDAEVISQEDLPI